MLTIEEVNNYDYAVIIAGEVHVLRPLPADGTSSCKDCSIHNECIALQSEIGICTSLFGDFADYMIFEKVDNNL